jgi:hypothetical protein
MDSIPEVNVFLMVSMRPASAALQPAESGTRADARPIPRPPGKSRAYAPRASSRALSVRSQVNVGSRRPKCP